MKKRFLNIRAKQVEEIIYLLRNPDKRINGILAERLERRLNSKPNTQPYTNGRRYWTEEEVNKFIEIMQGYIGTQHWVHGQRLLAWQAAAAELDRDVVSLKNKWSELKRKGLVREE